ncbi:LysR family transcriptional regulator [Ruixingdingia sedimenti]|uniref:LysR substrate-binding domain-containing protein n=1 Tax=Ruixingdingia sedimenti TaxID=3073604 RepID=A0ABU1F8R5_9RHOB|nr:LysR substrate-binding domain-containing protein [Xinfangfangia sp. LG-4]MDR5653260.1 LysR substrate-binding domain-containing protein [Xinfangfangia sp. LG-4]
MLLANLRTLKIDLRQLGYFTAIAECGSITKAAALMGIAQPSLSEAVARLERELDVALVVRTGRGIVLTDAGAALAEHGQSILAAVDAAMFDVRQRGQNLRGRIALGLPAIITSLLGVPVAETVAHQNPDIKLRINEGTSLVILDWLAQRRIDLAVSYEGYDFGGMDVQPFMAEDLYLLAAPDDWPGGADENGIARRPVRFEELADLPLILPNRPNGLRNLLDQAARSRKIELDSSIEFDALHNLVSMVMRELLHHPVPCRRGARCTERQDHPRPHRRAPRLPSLLRRAAQRRAGFPLQPAGGKPAGQHRHRDDRTLRPLRKDGTSGGAGRPILTAVRIPADARPVRR